MGKTEKKRKKITQLKQPKYQKPKDENMEWTKHMFILFKKKNPACISYLGLLFITENTLYVYSFLGFYNLVLGCWVSQLFGTLE